MTGSQPAPERPQIHDQQTVIRGPVRWKNPKNGEAMDVWERSKENGSKLQRFTCHELGIGRVYDSQGDRTFLPGRCKFPAGEGWQLGKRRACDDTAIEVQSITLDNTQPLTFSGGIGARKRMSICMHRKEGCCGPNGEPKKNFLKKENHPKRVTIDSHI